MSNPRRTRPAAGLSGSERRLLLRQLAEIHAELNELSERTNRLAGNVEAIRRAAVLGVVRG